MKELKLLIKQLILTLETDMHPKAERESKYLLFCARNKANIMQACKCLSIQLEAFNEFLNAKCGYQENVEPVEVANRGRFELSSTCFP